MFFQKMCVGGSHVGKSYKVFPILGVYCIFIKNLLKKSTGGSCFIPPTLIYSALFSSMLSRIWPGVSFKC